MRCQASVGHSLQLHLQKVQICAPIGQQTFPREHIWSQVSAPSEGLVVAAVPPALWLQHPSPRGYLYALLAGATRISRDVRKKRPRMSYENFEGVRSLNKGAKKTYHQPKHLTQKTRAIRPQQTAVVVLVASGRRPSPIKSRGSLLRVFFFEFSAGGTARVLYFITQAQAAQGPLKIKGGGNI